ncbi:MAG TPA: DUF6691 family protein [Puia sp.]|nr:DUF6691 family protein [Puia sp.]
MKAIKYILTGIVFGIIMTKSEAVSWYRIQEMFRFQSFFMYGIIGTAVITGIIVVALIRRFHAKDISGQPIEFYPKEKTWKKYLFGGTIFGLGWAMTGACPGPVFVLLGCGYSVMLVVIVGALLGTFTYGLIRDRLPH